MALNIDTIRSIGLKKKISLSYIFIIKIKPKNDNNHVMHLKLKYILY